MAADVNFPAGIWPPPAWSEDPADVDFFLAEGCCPSCNLSGAWLNGVSAEGEDLSFADLFGANFSGADLGFADLVTTVTDAATIANEQTICPGGSAGPCQF